MSLPQEAALGISTLVVVAPPSPQVIAVLAVGCVGVMIIKERQGKPVFTNVATAGSA